MTNLEKCLKRVEEAGIVLENCTTFSTDTSITVSENSGIYWVKFKTVTVPLETEEAKQVYDAACEKHRVFKLNHDKAVLENL